MCDDSFIASTLINQLVIFVWFHTRFWSATGDKKRTVAITLQPTTKRMQKKKKPTAARISASSVEQQQQTITKSIEK